MGFVTVVPVKRTSIPDALFEHLHTLFNSILDEGRTYPQEFELSGQAFEDYYFGEIADAWVRRDVEKIEDILGKDVKEYKEHVVGMYYVKPNYPGRSSHCCNGGFIVDPSHRGAGYGYILGMSYLQFAPRLGYLASVFNLVYANNTASLKIWDKLGFTRAGLIPRAGRLRKKGEDGEEFVDAVVFWKSLVADEAWTKRVTRTEP
ncbi:acyl-CoA N-acyltransferase [Calocera viscosa TUFC12733]|uniref:Acyl-CoA N-acyltransferase n=1 Tax=Calocera viscosa (strain TUFC12733) TaxID=1330018 RepID=A0A167N437_CALVF|nr:acyl-CoA N-acyltransferase [Calocera viscosa TUFC12733]